MKIKNKPLAAELGLFFVTIIWGSAFAVVKDATDTVPPSYLIVIRFGLASALMCIIFFKRLKRIRLAEIKGGLIVGILNVIGYELQTYGVKYTTAGKNAFLTAIYCVLVPFLYWAIKHRKPDGYNIISAFICIAGVGLLSLREGGSINFGDFLSLLCGVGFAFQIIAISIFTEKCDPILLAITQSVVTAAAALPFAAAVEHFPSHLEQNTILSLLYLAIFSSMVAFLLQMVCQKYVPPAKASLIMSLESVFGVLSGIIFLGESMTVRTFGGCALIFAAIYLSEAKPVLKRQKKNVHIDTQESK